MRTNAGTKFIIKWKNWNEQPEAMATMLNILYNFSSVFICKRIHISNPNILTVLRVLLNV